MTVSFFLQYGKSSSTDHSQSLPLGLSSLFGYFDCICKYNFSKFIFSILAPSYSLEEGLFRSLLGIQIRESFSKIWWLYLICVGRNVQKIVIQNLINNCRRKFKSDRLNLLKILSGIYAARTISERARRPVKSTTVRIYLSLYRTRLPPYSSSTWHYLR